MAASTARTMNAPVISWEKPQPQIKPVSKKNNPLLFIAIAALAILAISGIWRALNRPAPVQYVQVMATQRDIPAGTRLGFTTVRFLNVPAQFATADMVRSLNFAAGRVTRTFIPAGEPIRDFMLLPQRDGLSVNLETHERAMTLQLDDDAMVDHSILPEDRVDLLAISNKANKKYTKTICQAVRVLMSTPKEQSLARGSNATSNKITLAVTPQIAELITEALETGKIRLVLRSRLSRVEEHLAGAKPDDLLPASALADENPPPVTSVSAQILPPPPSAAELALQPVAETPKAPLQWMVEVISGNHKESYGVPAN